MAADWDALRVNAGKFHLNMKKFDGLEEFFRRLDGDFFRECAGETAGAFPMREAEARLTAAELPRFLLLCVVANYGTLERLYREKRWPEIMFREIAGDLSCWLNTLERDLGGYGLTPRIFEWCRAWLTGQVKSFGRLQGEDIHFFGLDRSVYRLPDGGLRSERAFQPGNPPRPDLVRGDKVINIHIPAAGALTREACVASLRRMRDFAADFHPDYDYRAFICESWLLDPRFQEILRPSSNILQFQKLGRLMPLPEIDQTGEVRWRIWGEAGRNMPAEKLPVSNSMEEGVARFLRDGGKFQAGLLVIFRDELPDLLG